MKKIISIFVVVCMLITTLINNVYADDVIDPVLRGCDFYIFTNEFMSAYREGVLQTDFFNDKDLNDVDGLDLTYDVDNGEYTLNITKDVTLKANKDICSNNFYESDYSMIYVNNKKLNIVGEGTLSLVTATDEFANNCEPKCIYLWESTLNIGAPNSETRTKLIIKDESPSSCEIDSFGIYSFRDSSVSINNSNIEIRTSKAGIVVADVDEYEGTLNINDSNVDLICKDNNTFNDYYGISHCSWILDRFGCDYNFNNTKFIFSSSFLDNEIQQPIHCIETDQKVIIDNCRINIDGDAYSLICAGEWCQDPETCIKIIDSNIIANCTIECINSKGLGDLFIEDSYIDLNSIYESAIKVCNNIIVTYTPEGSKNYGEVLGKDEVSFNFSVKTENPNLSAFRYEVSGFDGRWGSRLGDNDHKMIINIAPTLSSENEQFNIIDFHDGGSIEIDLTDEDIMSTLKCLTMNKVAAVIHFDSNGGMPSYGPIIIENYGEININDYIPTRSGFVFGGWNPVFGVGTENEKLIDIEFLSDYIDSNNPATFDHTFRAKWIEDVPQGGDDGGSSHNHEHKYQIPKTGIK